MRLCFSGSTSFCACALCYCGVPQFDTRRQPWKTSRPSRTSSSIHQVIYLD